jgi:formylglycine-generating enzyme required for sulfatase activity
VASIVLVLLLVLVLGTSSSSRPQATTPLPTPTPSKQGPPTPQTQHPAPSKSAPSPISEETAPPAPIPTSWERAWSEADAKSKALIADQRFGDAATIYENMAKAFEDLRLKDRAQKAQAAIFAQADAAYADLETKAKKLLADKKLDEARSLLRPVLDRFGLPLKAAAARKLLAQVDAAEPEPKEDQWGEWVSLFDGKTLNGWRVPEEGNFARHGKLFVEGAALVLERGEQATGLAWTGEFPNEGYECSLELKPIVLGNAALEVVLPVGALQCDLGVATWDNAVTGLQMIDGQLANNNETTKRFGLQAGRWYQVRIRVTSRKVEAWLDADQVVDMPRAGRTLTLHTDNEPLKPFGLGQGRAVSSVRNIRLRRLKPPAEDPLVFTKWPFDEAEAKRRQEETAKALGVKVEQDIDLGGGVKMTFVLIPAGEFLMGSPPTTSPEQLVKQYGCPVEEFQREFPAHRVRLTKPFWLGKYEVTQEQWTAVLRTNPSVFKDRPKNPVENVDWNEARGFAKALGEKLGKTFRLPTEAEWEYACRAGTASEFYFGNDAAKGADFGWAGAGSTAPVGQKKPNAWGLCDTVGNVWELCEDVYANYESAAQTDPKGAPAGPARVFRGGGWVNLPAYFRSAFRTHSSPNARDYSIGIRLVFAPEPARPQVQPPPRTETPQPAEPRAAAYAPESDKVWDLFRQRKYAEAETRLGELAKRAEFRATAPLKADTEAAALLKDFWAAAEKGLCEAKGRFLSVAGTSGTLEEAKDGVVRIRTAQGKPEEKELTELATKQALAYSGLRDKADPRAKLMVGVFLLAEGVFLDEAGKALAGAGEGPSVALYKERLNAQLAVAAETAAQKAWSRIQDEAKAKPSPALGKRLSDLLEDFEKKHAESRFHKGLTADLADLRIRIEDLHLCWTKWPFDGAEATRRQKVTADALGVKVEQEIEIAKGVKMAFVLIPPGEFLMGSPPTTSPEKLAASYGSDPPAGVKVYEGEFPQHRAKISRPFWMAKYEVTQEQYVAILQRNPSGNKDKPKNPVEQVDWSQADGFAKVLSEKLGKTFRLPTEAEWEYACRAGTATEFYFGNDAAKVGDYGWASVNSPAPVGMKKPNAWGLCDMGGNVWEWCEDWYGQYDGAAQTDPKGAPTGAWRVQRGGSFFSWSPRHLRSAFRQPNVPSCRNGDGGLRVVLAPGPR